MAGSRAEFKLLHKLPKLRVMRSNPLGAQGLESPTQNCGRGALAIPDQSAGSGQGAPARNLDRSGVTHICGVRKVCEKGRSGSKPLKLDQTRIPISSTYSNS